MNVLGWVLALLAGGGAIYVVKTQGDAAEAAKTAATSAQLAAAGGGGSSNTTITNNPGLDLDGDGKITDADLQLLLPRSTTTEPLPDPLKDSDGDGVPDAVDYFPLDATKYLNPLDLAQLGLLSDQKRLTEQQIEESKARILQEEKFYAWQMSQGHNNPVDPPTPPLPDPPAPTPLPDPPAPVGNALTVYEHNFYGGKSVGLAPGRYDLGDLERLGIANDWISSLRVAKGYRVSAYSDAGFHGEVLGGTADLDNLVPFGWNDRISSIIVAKTESAPTPPPTPSPSPPKGPTGVKVYQNPKYSGKAFSLPAGRYDATDLQRLGIDNWISSFLVVNGYRVAAYADPGFKGESIGGTASLDDLVRFGWNDRISSLIVTKV